MCRVYKLFWVQRVFDCLNSFGTLPASLHTIGVATSVYNVDVAHLSLQIQYQVFNYCKNMYFTIYQSIFDSIVWYFCKKKIKLKHHVYTNIYLTCHKWIMETRMGN